jgi:hypothetical protein
MKTEKSQKHNMIDIEVFYQALKDDPKLLEEAFERITGILEMDSKAVKKMARQIKKDFHSLYNEVVTLSKLEKSQVKSSSCCGGN